MFQRRRKCPCCSLVAPGQPRATPLSVRHEVSPRAARIATASTARGGVADAVATETNVDSASRAPDLVERRIFMRGVLSRYRAGRRKRGQRVPKPTMRHGRVPDRGACEAVLRRRKVRACRSPRHGPVCESRVVDSTNRSSFPTDTSVDRYRRVPMLQTQVTSPPNLPGRRQPLAV